MSGKILQWRLLDIETSFFRSFYITNSNSLVVMRLADFLSSPIRCWEAGVELLTIKVDLFTSSFTTIIFAFLRVSGNTNLDCYVSFSCRLLTYFLGFHLDYLIVVLNTFLSMFFIVVLGVTISLTYNSLLVSTFYHFVWSVQTLLPFGSYYLFYFQVSLFWVSYLCYNFFSVIKYDL